MESDTELCLKRSSFPEQKQPLKKRRIVPFESAQETNEILISNQFTANNERSGNEIEKPSPSIGTSADVYHDLPSVASQSSVALESSECSNYKLVSTERKQTDVATSDVNDISSQLSVNVKRHESTNEVEALDLGIKVTSEPVRETFLSPDATQSESELPCLQSSGTAKASYIKKNRIRARRKLVMSEENSDGTRKMDEGKFKITEKNKTRRRQREESSTLQDVDDMLQGMEGEIDNILEETAQKNKLTTTNVKNILRHVITNECVLSMVRNTMNIDSGNYDGVEEAVYEPKLTRSKARELMEKQVMLPWPVSPLRTTKTSTSKKLLEEEFSEDESSDEEYKPNAETICHSEDDDDGLSQPSDIGSPECSLPSTPRTPVTPLDTCEDGIAETVISTTESPSQKIDKIALRTRSKLPLNDTPLEEIEASFVAPDITIDMYDSECDDENWNNFLNNFCKPLDAVDPSDIGDDDANDPEYNFLEEEDVLDEWDFRNDRAVKISKKELTELMTELLEAAEQELAEGDDEEEISSTLRLSSQKLNASDVTVSNIPTTTTALFSQINRDCLNEQMRMHVQLLTQEYLLSMGNSLLKEVTDSSYNLLEELYRFGTREFKAGQQSAFYAQNLEESWKIVSNMQHCSTPPKDSPYVGTGKSNRKNNLWISSKVKEIIAKSKAFIYPELLPTCGFCTYVEKPKVTFTRAEDHLIALGLEQFRPITNTNDAILIRTLLLPTKTDRQIRVRIKNVKSSKTMEENPIKYYFKHGVAPPVIHVPKLISPGSIVSPYKQPPELVPEWMKPLLQRYSTVIAPSPVVKASTSPQKFSTSPVYVSISSNSLAPHIFMKTSSTLARTPEKRKYNPILPRPFASFGTSRNSPKHISPLKQISPILKKYGYQRRVLPRGVLQFNMSPTKKGNDKKQNKNLLSDENKKCSRHLCEALDKSVAAKPVSNETEGGTIVHDSAVIVDVNTKCENGGELQYNTIETNSVGIDNTHIEQVETHNTSQDVEAPMEIDSHCDIDLVEENGEGEVEDEVVDDESDLAALMAASSTICKRQQQNPLMKKKNKQQKELESTLALLAPDLLESDPKKDERETAFVNSYLLKVKETLKDDIETYEVFLKTLCEFENSNRTPTQLYETLSLVLHSYPMLVDDFVGFLLPEQAKDCGKMAEYFTLNKIRMFLRKLEVHFSHQPQHIQRILKTLSNLQWQLNLNSSTVRLALQPLLRGQNHLLEEFLQLLPDEPPPESLMTDFEEITIPDSEEDYSNDSVEEITIPEYDNKYGGKQCPCSCHVQANDIRMQNRIRHCIQCGIKFLDGRIYIQTGKALKPAQVIYYNPGILTPTINEEIKQDGLHNSYNSPIQQGSESPLSSLSPSPVAATSQAEEEPQEECEVVTPVSSENEVHHHISDSAAQSTTFQTDQQKHNAFKNSLPSVHCSQESAHTDHPLLGVLDDFSKSASLPSALLNSSHVVIEDAILPPETSKKSHAIPSDFSTLRDVIKLNTDCSNNHGQCTRPVILLNSYNTNDMGKQNTLEKPNSTDINTVLSDCKTAVTSLSTMETTSANRSERACFAATSDVTSITNTEGGRTDVLSAIKWTRDEDKVLLETCQKMGTTEDAFLLVARRLKNKHQHQVASRFQELMKLFTTHDDESDVEEQEYG